MHWRFPADQGITLKSFVFTVVCTSRVAWEEIQIRKGLGLDVRRRGSNYWATPVLQLLRCLDFIESLARGSRICRGMLLQNVFPLEGNRKSDERTQGNSYRRIRRSFIRYATPIELYRDLNILKEFPLAKRLVTITPHL